ncbi:MAG TPA: hypothetical protein VF624_13340 [Tepidisphaeraceae bacterium]
MIFSTNAPSRARRSVLALAVAGIVGIGCDVREPANQAVRKALEDAQQKSFAADQVPVDPSAEPGKLVLANESAALDPARQAIAPALTQTTADPALLAVASSTAADLDLQAARLNRGKLIALEQQIRDHLTALRAMSTQIALSNYLVAGYAKRDPAEALAKINAIISAIKGAGGAATWTPSGDVEMLTAAAAAKDVARLESEVKSRSEEIEKLTAERTAAVAEADEKLKAADAAKGAAAVAVFKESAEARRRGDELVIKGDLVTEALTRAQADLEIAKGNLAALQAGVTTLETQSGAYQQGWKSLGERTAAHRKLSGEIYRDAKSGPTIDALLTTVNDLSNQAAALRASTNEDLIKADKNYVGASQAGKLIGTEIAEHSGAKPEDLKNWNALRAGVHPNGFLLHQGAVRRELGTLGLAEASLLSEIESTRALVKTVLDAAGLPAPAEGAAVDKQRLTEIIGGASDNFDLSMSILQSCESGDAPKDVKDSAMASRLATYSAMIQLQNVRQMMGEADAAAKAQQLTTEGIDLRNQLIERKLPLPAVPGELGKSPPPAPAAAPAAGPAPLPGAPAPAPGTVTPPPGGPTPVPGAPAAPEAPAAPTAPPEAPAPAAE